MAKLSAHGTEVHRIESFHRGENCTVRNTRVLMSDGKVLSKADFYHADKAMNHSTGWKLTGTTKLSPDVWLQSCLKLGYQEVK